MDGRIGSKMGISFPGIIFFSLYIILSILSKLGILGNVLPFWNSLDQIYKALIADGIFVLSGVLIFRIKIINGIQHIKSDFEKYHKQIIYASFFGEAASLLINLLLIVVLRADNVHQGNIDDVVGKQNLIVVIVCVAILGPIIEELLYRAVLFGGLIKQNRIVAYVISSGMFGLVHVWFEAFVEGHPLQLLFSLVYIASGISYAYIYEKTENIMWPIIVHVLVNMLALI